MKKLISLILATLLVVSLLPASFASAEAAPTKLEYTFNQLSHGLDADVSYNALDFTIDGTVSGARWGFDGMDHTKAFPNLGSYSVHHSTDTIYTAMPYNNGEFWTYSADLNEGNAASYPLVMILLEVPTAGTYVPTLEFGYKSTNQYNFELALIKETAETKAMGARALLRAHMSEGRIGAHDLGAAYTSTQAAVTLEKGNYYLVIAPNGGGTGAVADGQSQTWIKKFTLDPVSVKEERDPYVADAEYTYNFSAYVYNYGNDTNSDGTPDLFCDTGTEADGSNLIPTTMYNTWTDKTADKFIPYFVTANDANGGDSKKWESDTGSTTATHARARGREAWLLYVGESGILQYSTVYDYQNPNLTDPWAWVNTGEGRYQRIDTARSFLQIGRAYFYVNGDGFGAGAFPYVSFKVKVPTSGKYDLTLNTGGHTQMDAVSVYVSPVATTTANRAGLTAASTLVGTFDATTQANATFSKAIDVQKAGEYYVTVAFGNTTGKLAYNPLYICLNSLVLKAVEEATDFPEPEKSAATIEKETIQNVDPENPTPSTNAEGTSATVTVLATDFDEGELEEVVDSQAKTAGDEVEVTAPEIDGYSFRYWAKGLGTKRVAVSEEETYTFTATRGANYVYAVYTNDAEEKTIVEFYNANRQLVSRKYYDVTAPITVPDLPDTTYGAAEAWVDADGEEIAANPVAEGRIMVYVAKYPETSANTVAITVNGDEETYAYGETVTLTATSRENGTGYKVFSYWEDENAGVVSFDRTYTFSAVAPRTLTAVYADYAPIKRDIRKIVTAKNGDIITAEFIGCTDALERGFTFSTGKKAVMTSDAKTFTMILDADVEAQAYAVFEDGIIYGDFE